MRTRETGAVGLLVHDIRNPIFAAFAQTAQEYLSRAGFLLVLTGSEASGQSDAALISVLGQRRMDGLIAFLRDENDLEVEQALERFGGAVVLIDRHTQQSVDLVLTDHAGGVKQATEHLFHLGHRRVALITGAKRILPGRERVVGYTKAHEGAKIKIDLDLIRPGSLQADYGYRETFSLLALPDPPTAIIAGGNQLLEGVVRALKTTGTKIPSEVSVVGYDDSPLAALATPSITVARRDVTAMGATAAELLVHRLRGHRDDPARRILLAMELVVRESSAAAPIRRA